MAQFNIGDVVKEVPGSFHHHNKLMQVIGPSVSPMRVRCRWVWEDAVLADSILREFLEKTELDNATFVEWLEHGLL